MKTLILITGSTRGLGQAIKNKFDLENHTVISINRVAKNPDDIVIDLTKKIANMHLLKTKIEEFDTIVFINNAGEINPIKLIGTLTSVEVLKATYINWYNPSLLINEIVKSGKFFYILNITSGAAFSTNVKLSIYSSTKAALHRFIEILSKEQIGEKKCLGIYNFDPGRMQTEMQQHLLEKLYGEITQDIYLALPKTTEIANKLYEKIWTDLNNAKKN